jgi:aryl-alcohol dehydrogenase-like predicted oxidoreductase
VDSSASFHRNTDNPMPSETQQPPKAPDAALSGTFRIGGALEVNRLGFGAMRVTGPGIWGEPEDRAEALRTLKRVPQLGVNFIDTADSYGPDVSEQLIREVLHPYEGLVIATKAGLTRPGPRDWVSRGEPDYLIAQAEKSLEKLGVDRIDLWQLHRIDPKVAREAQLAAVTQLLDRKNIRFAGLSNVSVEDIKAASKLFPVATVQNHYNRVDRRNEDGLDHCEQNGIGFIPGYPLGGGDFGKASSALAEVAQRHDATVGQIALAWLLKRSPVMLPIPGTSKVAHLEENVAAAAIVLSDDDMTKLNGAG